MKGPELPITIRDHTDLVCTYGGSTTEDYGTTSLGDLRTTYLQRRHETPRKKEAHADKKGRSKYLRQRGKRKKRSVR